MKINPATLTTNRRLNGDVPLYWVWKAAFLNALARARGEA